MQVTFLIMRLSKRRMRLTPPPLRCIEDRWIREIQLPACGHQSFYVDRRMGI